MDHDHDLDSFIDAVPQPITHALVTLSPALAAVAQFTQLLDWSVDWYASWLLLAGWWLVVCLPAYTLPLVITVLLLFIRSSQLSQNSSSQPVTEFVLQRAIVDLTILANALPSLPTLSLPPLPLLRAIAILTLPWLLLNYFVPTRLIVAVVGSFILTYRAPWARVLRNLLSNSAHLRSATHAAYAFLTGQPRPPRIVSSQPSLATPAPVPSVRFLFSIYENQRWWMGLDWTAALLPSERPSWSSPALHPLSPPTAFPLPDTSTVYLPTPDGKSRIKRTAVWRWDEPEWRLLVRKEGSSLSRIERSPPQPSSPDDTNPLTNSSSSATSSGTRLLKAAANKFNSSSSITSSSQSPPAIPTSPPPPPADHSSTDTSTDQDDSGEPLTDPDGWIYGDNKWENQSHRGGLGKYTRYRRWTRVAIVSESVEVVPPGAMGVQQQQTSPPAHVQTQPSKNTNSSKRRSSPPSPITMTTKLSSSDPKTQSPELASDPSTIMTPTPSASTSAINNNNNNLPDPPESPLRQRLRAALSKSSISVP